MSTPEPPDHDDLGGDPACWAHLFELPDEDEPPGDAAPDEEPPGDGR